LLEAVGALPRLESWPELDLHPFRLFDSIEVLADFSSMAGEVGGDGEGQKG
jgi:hypothetical protein